MGTFGIILIIIAFIVLKVWLDGIESKDLKSKGIKCPYCSGTSVNRTSGVATMNHKQHHKQFKCNNCGAYF